MDELDERKLKILHAIIQNYLETGEPVGSRTISKYADLNLSSATIRNEMADLEELGYIIQPHTSAGRIPTDKGYRLYVDNMLKEKEEELAGREQEVEKMKDFLSEKEKSTPHFRDLSFVPLALPGAAGPGTIALLISSASTLQSTYQTLPLVIHLAAATVFIITALIFWIALRCSGRIMKVLGESGIDAISRVVGFLLVCMGVQFVINGGFELASTPMH